MNRYGFYEEFIKANKIRLKELFNELHTCYEVRNNLYRIVKKHELVFKAIGTDFSVFDRAMHDKPTKVILNGRSRAKLTKELADTVGSFAYVTFTKIPVIKHEIKIVRLMCLMPDRMFFMIQYNFNREIANTILRGGVYYFGQGLSKLGISYVKRSPNAKPCIDWGESNKLKAKLIEQGYQVKSKDNPTGIKWLLFRTDDGYCFWKWLKRDAFTPNKKMYKFRAIATNNESTEYNGAFNQEEILDKSIGTFDKMMALLKLNPQIIERYDF